MSRVSLAKTESEQWQDIWTRYQKAHPGAIKFEDVVDWAVANGLADLPKENPRAILLRRLKRAAREYRIQDPQGRKVRGMLPAKLQAVDANGNLYFDVVWDHIHKMSADHALLSFEQRDKNIAKQQRSATRDLQSFLANNPNAKGHEQQFVFDFEVAEQTSKVVETIKESGGKKKPR